MKTPLVVPVNVALWYRGQGFYGSCLLRDDGRKCCIGFLASELGCTDKQMLGCSTLDSVESVKARKFLPHHGVFLQSAYYLNDSTTLSDTERQRELIALGKSAGIEFRFLDDTKEEAT